MTVISDKTGKPVKRPGGDEIVADGEGVRVPMKLMDDKVTGQVEEPATKLPAEPDPDEVRREAERRAGASEEARKAWKEELGKKWKTKEGK